MQPIYPPPPPEKLVSERYARLSEPSFFESLGRGSLAPRIAHLFRGVEPPPPRKKSRRFVRSASWLLFVSSMATAAPSFAEIFSNLPNTSTLSEGGSVAHDVSVSSAPANIRISSSNPDVTISPSNINITSHTTIITSVTYSIVHDGDTTDETATISYSDTSDSTGSRNPTITRTINITDDDDVAAAGTIQVTPARTLSIDEGNSGTLSVSLSTAPNADVTVSLAKTNSDVTLSPTSLTFTASNWSAAQTVTVSTDQDADADDDTDTITFSASGGIVAPNVTKAVDIDDDETGGTIEVTPAGTLLIDEGSSSTLSVSLSAAPNADVTLSLAKTNSDVTLSPTSLAFTASNWSTAQTVTVSAGHDDDNSDDSDTITFSASGGIIAPNVTKTVAIYDDEAGPGFDITPASLSLTEGGQVTFQIRLKTQPSSIVAAIFSIRSLDQASDTLTLDADPSTTGNQNTMIFNDSGPTLIWNQYQTVTVFAAHDGDTKDESFEISTSISGAPEYRGVRRIVKVTVTDDEPGQAPAGTIQITPAGTLSIDEGDSGTISVSLSAAPNADATVTLAKTNADVSLSPTSLTFTSSNHSTAQTVNVSAGHDDDADDDSDTITLSASGGIVAPNVTKAVAIDDDDSPSGTIEVTPSGTLSIDEGDSGTISVSLSAAPNADATVTLAKTNADVSLSPASLTFTSSNHSTAQTVTVSAGHDNDADDDSDTITLSASGGIVAPNVTKAVAIDDDDSPTPSGTIEITPAGTLSIDEGDSGILSVSLSAAPNADVTVTLAKTNADVSLSPASLTFTSSNHSTAQTVTVSAGHDNDADDDSDTITLSASGGIVAPNVTKAVAIDDDEPGQAPAGTIQITPAGTLSIDEGDSGTLSVSLSVAPNADATVTLAKTNADVSLSPTSLTFTSSNHSTAQTVTVSAGHDDDADDDSDTITLSASGGIVAPNVTKAVAIDDDDSPTPSGTIEVTPSGTLSIDEGDSGTLSVSLSAAPNADVTVTLAKTNADVSLSPTSLTFTSSNHSTAQTVTVSAGHDDDADDDSDTITLSASGGIVAPNVTKAVAIDDDDSPTPSGTIEVTPSGTLSIDEGDSGNLSVSLSAAPNADVTVTLAKTNSDVSLSPTSLTFTSSNHSTAQTVTVSAGHDDDADDDSDTITLSASGGIVAPNVTKAVAINDDSPSPPTIPAGTIEVTPSGTLSIDEGDSGILSVSLSVAPNADATVTLAKTNADVTLSPTSLTFTSSNHSTAQTVTVSAGHDDDADDDSDTITLSASGGIAAPNVTKQVAIDDDDSPTPSGTIEVTPSGALSIDEGDSGTLSVSLSVAPNADVTVSLAKTDSDVTLSPTSLTFTASNWPTAQTVTVSAGHDNDADDDSDTITLSAKGGIDAPRATKAVFVDDDDVAGDIVLAPAGSLTVDEGTSQVFTVRLSNRPNADVTISLAKTGDADTTLDKTSLTFTTSNWNTPRNITVLAKDDDDDASESDIITLTAAGGIVAPEAEYTVRVADDSAPSGTMLITPAGTLSVTEGGSGTLTLRLSHPPNADVTIALSKSAGAAIEFDRPSLVFTTSNWDRSQALTLSVAHDANTESGVAIITLTATGGINAPDVNVPVRILGSPGEFALAPSMLNLTEGGTSVELEARLETRAVGTSTVVVTLTADRSGIEMTPQTLVFPFDDWDSPKKVSVRAVDDSNALDERVIITAIAVGGNYRHAERRATASVRDDDDKPASLPPVKTRALAFPPTEAPDSAVMRVRCRQDSPCDVVLDCHAQADGSTFEGSLPEPIPAWGTVTLTAADIEGHTGASWAGKGRLGCALRSEGNLSSQFWTRSGDGVLVNNSAFIRSVAEGDDHRADIESIPEPESAERSNFRIRCEASQGRKCTATRFSCYDDAGGRHDGDLGTIERRQVRHLQTAELVDIIGHRWQGLGLVCELRSSAPFTVQVLTRTGGGGALVNNSATGEQ